MPDKKCDLHIHSVFSDSDAGIESIFEEASRKKLACISITDHDNIDAVVAARDYSKAYGIELVEGIELSAQHRDVEVHILGYFIDSDNLKLKSELSHLKELRRKRIIWMAEKLNSLGVAVDTEEMFSRIRDSIPTRLHLGLYLVGKGRVSSLREAFRKYLSPGRPAYRARFKYSVKEAVDLIKECGGLSVLAHPHMLSDQSWIDEFINVGIEGLEVVYHSMSQAKSRLYKSITEEKGLLKSGGSDAHGSYKEFTGIGAVSIPYAWVEEMKRCLKIPLT